jgi:hypothetical protein
MRKVLVDQITEGMMLGKDVCGSSGNILLGKGIPMNPGLGRRLKNWGIPFVYVEGEDDALPLETQPQVAPEAIKIALEKKFSAVISNNIMKKIFAAAFQFNLKHQANGSL